ncbi:fibronectin type III domain-containing protein-like [Dendronephthya gigantea]|uniref:fibronectin type III domain-containing protein-like n=1 Tax=Dendronephthya gigantea TaxID=151771 RepID=UPI001068EFE9|nr:fibronectin type III domain-containing protein-like [Dendronephthya gigantea]
MIWLLLFALALVSGQEKIPKIFKDADDVYSFPDNFQRLRVETNDVPSANYYWLKDDKKITGKTEPKFLQYDQRILMPETKDKKYAGKYQFVMVTDAGTIKGREVKVEFTYAGEFDQTVPPNRTEDVVVGQANFIKCPKHEPGSNVIYKWGKSTAITGTKFLEIRPNYIVLDDGTLFYSHLTEENANQFNKYGWVCGMEAKVGDKNQFGWAEHVITTFKIVNTNTTEFGPKIVTRLPQNKRFQEGDTISMKCAAAGRPTPSYSWKRIDVEGKEHAIVNGKGGMKFEDGDARLLVLNSAKREHSGRYFCTASIGNKNDTVEGSLTFEVEPKWVGKDIESVEPSIYTSHSWTCNATGFPAPKYKWYKNGDQIQSSKTHVIDKGTITFPNLTQADTAMYQCVAENTMDNIYQTAYLDVQAEKPVFNMNTGKTTLFLGAKGTIKCHAKAAPAAKNTWEKDGVKINISFSRYTLVNNEHLVIDPVKKQDIGNYTCKAKNLYGEDVKKIIVQVVGEVTFISEPNDVIAKKGESFKLKCEAEGDKDSSFRATIKYKWKYNDKDIELNDTIVWSDDAHSLVFLNAQVRQSGKYTCIAYIDKPSYAEKKSSAKVVIRGPPEAPNKVQIEGDCSKFSAKLTWNIPGNNYDPIKHFIIETATTYDTEWHKNESDHIDPNLKEKTIKGLSPWTSYRFRVLAFNAIGQSDPSEPTELKNCKTPQKAPFICPAVEAIPGKANELTLKWKEIKLMERNGESFRYLLQYWPDASPEKRRNKTFNPVQLEFEVPNAGYYQLWKFQIQGVNKVGAGPYCTGQSRSGQNAPTVAPTKLTVTESGATYIVLEWEAISLERGSVDGYHITYYTDSEASDSRRSISANDCDRKSPCVRNVIGGNTKITRLDGLLPYTNYRISIYGYNSGGRGPEASTSYKTDPDLPGIPEVEVEAFARFVEVFWKKPKQPNGEITGYEVEIDKDADPKVVTLGPTSMEHTFGGLEPNKSYVVSVRAKTAAGFGLKKRYHVQTKLPILPGKPKIPIVKGIGEDGVNVTFRRNKSGGFPEKFIVRYRIKDGGDWNETDPVPLYGPNSKPYVEIFGLDNDKEYEISTFAVNEKGPSETSDIETVKPGQEEGETPIAQSSPIYKRSWFVAMVVIVCLLLILLLIALLITRKRGERYPVGKREKKRAGILDVGEEPDYNMYPMKPARPNGNGISRQDSGVSDPNRDPDRDSLDDYGEDRFDEDAASLIGAYNDDRRHNKAVDEPEFV